ncbi:MAG: hypothetical protein QOE70_6377 [Chthoniobacter sp.]|jgi:hypothetical protein|nr:hypothetical protein [Chthoniobacter sp.]
MKKTTTTTKKTATAKKATTKKTPAAAAAPAAKNQKASWLVARLRNALHKSRPALKEGKSLREVSTLSEMKAALSLPREEWENLLETFFNLGGKLEEKAA